MNDPLIALAMLLLIGVVITILAVDFNRPSKGAKSQVTRDEVLELMEGEFPHLRKDDLQAMDDLTHLDRRMQDIRRRADQARQANK